MTANNIKVATQSFFNRQGGVDQVERLSFFVGDHGPFFKDFPAGQDNTMDISVYIQQKVAQMNQLAALEGK